MVRPRQQSEPWQANATSQPVVLMQIDELPDRSQRGVGPFDCLQQIPKSPRPFSGHRKAGIGSPLLAANHADGQHAHSNRDSFSTTGLQHV